MAATWTPGEVTVSDRNAQIISVTMTRTDGANVRTYTLNGFNADPVGKVAVDIPAKIADGITALRAAELKAEAADAAIKSDLAAKVAAVLNGREK